MRPALGMTLLCLDMFDWIKTGAGGVGGGALGGGVVFTRNFVCLSKNLRNAGGGGGQKKKIKILNA